MSIVKTIPQDSRFIQTVATFDATFNSPTAARYDFATASNTGITISKINNTSIYLIERVSFAATIPDGVFLSAFDVANIPRFRLRYRVSQKRIYDNDLPTVNYIDGQEIIAYAESAQQTGNIGNRAISDEILVDMVGAVTQPAALVGIPVVRAQLTFNIYEIRNSKWIEGFHNERGNDNANPYK